MSKPVARRGIERSWWGRLIRYLGGWSEGVSQRRHGKRDVTDERILGSGDFVQRLLKEAETRQKTYFSAIERQQNIRELIVKTCKAENINLLELQSGSRRRPVAQTRFHLAHQLVEFHGVPLASVARELGVTTSAISKIIQRKDP